MSATFINPRSKVLAYVDRLVDWRRGDRRAPVTVEWDLSNRCSLGCQSCHFAHTHSKGPWTVRADRRLPMAFDPCGDLAQIPVVERALRQMAAAGVKAVIWSGGGEPTLHPRWSEAVASAHAFGLEQGMYTLGGHFTEASARFLRDTASWVVVSLDAVDGRAYAAEKGAPESRFDDACDGVRWLSGGHAAVGVSFLLHAGNWSKTKAMLALARSLGATYTTFRPAIETDADTPATCIADRHWITWGEQNLRRLAEETDVELDVDRFLAYRDWNGHGYTSCRGIQLNATVTPDGRVWVCPQRRGSPAGLLGDLSRESFEDIWARHPGQFAVDAGCRVMCRLHPVNQTIEQLDAPRLHGAFV